MSEVSDLYTFWEKHAIERGDADPAKLANDAWTAYDFQTAYPTAELDTQLLGWDKRYTRRVLNLVRMRPEVVSLDAAATAELGAATEEEIVATPGTAGETTEVPLDSTDVTVVQLHKYQTERVDLERTGTDDVTDILAVIPEEEPAESTLRVVEDIVHEPLLPEEEPVVPIAEPQTEPRRQGKKPEELGLPPDSWEEIQTRFQQATGIDIGALTGVKERAQRPGRPQATCAEDIRARLGYVFDQPNRLGLLAAAQLPDPEIRRLGQVLGYRVETNKRGEKTLREHTQRSMSEVLAIVNRSKGPEEAKIVEGQMRNGFNLLAANFEKSKKMAANYANQRS